MPRDSKVSQFMTTEVLAFGADDNLQQVMQTTVDRSIHGAPVVDADGMGRAFPEIQMCTPTLWGISCTPMSLTDDKGNVCVVDAVTNLSVTAVQPF